MMLATKIWQKPFADSTEVCTLQNHFPVSLKTKGTNEVERMRWNSCIEAQERGEITKFHEGKFG